MWFSSLLFAMTPKSIFSWLRPALDCVGSKHVCGPPAGGRHRFEAMHRCHVTTVLCGEPLGPVCSLMPVMSTRSVVLAPAPVCGSVCGQAPVSGTQRRQPIQSPGRAAVTPMPPQGPCSAFLDMLCHVTVHGECIGLAKSLQKVVSKYLLV